MKLRKKIEPWGGGGEGVAGVPLDPAMVTSICMTNIQAVRPPYSRKTTVMLIDFNQPLCMSTGRLLLIPCRHLNSSKKKSSYWKNHNKLT